MLLDNRVLGNQTDRLYQDAWIFCLYLLLFVFIKSTLATGDQQYESDVVVTMYKLGFAVTLLAASICRFEPHLCNGIAEFDLYGETLDCMKNKE